MKPDYIKKFEELGFGMFVHFGLYSMVGKGEWHYQCDPKCDKKYYFSSEFANKFNPKKDWAIKLVKQAKKSGMKYITLTTKHHEGFCLYDSCGLTEWDCIHFGPKRDLLREFVDACNQEGIVPFFYHALLDWHAYDKWYVEEKMKTNFDQYIDYLIKSVELLCKNYGKIGGLWFDGQWAYPNGDWQFERLYKTIRKYQPEAMIINNSGMSNEGAILHHEIDSVTYERGNPKKVPNIDGKERAGEMCEVFGYHWGYTEHDLDRKPFKQILSSLISCRHCNCNMLLNIGPKGDGSINITDKIYLDNLGYWIKRNKNFIYKAKGSSIVAENAKVLEDENYYYFVIENVPMVADPNVQLSGASTVVKVDDLKIKNAKYLDNNFKVVTSKDKHSFTIEPYRYGESGYARVVRFKK